MDFELREFIVFCRENGVLECKLPDGTEFKLTPLSAESPVLKPKQTNDNIAGYGPMSDSTDLAHQVDMELFGAPLK